MSNRLNIMSLFGSNPNASPRMENPGQPPQQQESQQQPTQQTNADPNGMKPQPQGQNGPAAFDKSTNQDPKGTTEKGQESPLDKFAELFKIEAKKDGESPADNDPNAPIFDVSSTEDLAKWANERDFINSQANAELFQKALQGDAESLGQLLNAASRSAYVENAKFSGAMGNAVAVEVMKRVEQMLPAKMKDYSSAEKTTDLNPVFKHEAMRPMVDSIRAQIQRKYPDASASEISSLTNDYLTGISKELNKSSSQEDPTDRRKSENQQSMDFSSFFS